VLPTHRLNLYLAEVEHSPLLFQIMLPIDYLAADFALIGDPRTVGEQVVKGIGFESVPSGILAMLLAIP
jgi:hypothetical protein